MISPYDLGNNLVEHTRRININDLLRKANLSFKSQLIKSEIEALGVLVSLTTSKTRFNGSRLWFKCPVCGKRRENLYLNQNKIACRKCNSLKYTKQRYKGMVERQSYPTV